MIPPFRQPTWLRPRLAPRIVALGGRVETSYRGDVQSLLPIDAILPLADDAQVRRIRLPLKPPHLRLYQRGSVQDRSRFLAAPGAVPQSRCR